MKKEKQQLNLREESMLRTAQNKLGLEDSFTFNCRACGSCCRNRDDILLSPQDLFRASQQLGMSPQEFFDKYCEGYIGHSSNIPIIRLRPKETPYLATFRDPRKRATYTCPLLKNDKCIIHAEKPRVCSLFPLGRMYMHNTKEIVYGTNGSTCGKGGPSCTVREWLALFKIPEKDEAFIKWSNFIAEFSALGRKIQNWSEKPKKIIWNAYLSMIYFTYDGAKDFLPQFEKNVSGFKGIMKIVDDCFSGTMDL